MGRGWRRVGKRPHQFDRPVRAGHGGSGFAHRQHPTDRGVLMALVSITRDSGRSPDDDWSAQIDPHRPRGPAPASFRSDLPVEPPMRTVVWRAALRRQPPRRRTEPTCSTVDRSAPEAQSEARLIIRDLPLRGSS
jgi:hypothetical protein